MTMNGAREARYAVWWQAEGRFLDMTPAKARAVFTAGYAAAMGQQYHRRHDDPHETPEELLDLARESTHD